MLFNYLERQSDRFLVYFSYVRPAIGTELDYLHQRMKKGSNPDQKKFAKGFEDCLEIGRSFYIFDNGRFQCDIEEDFPCSISNVNHLKKKAEQGSLFDSSRMMQKFMTCLWSSADKGFYLKRAMEELEFCLTETQDCYEGIV